MTNEAFEALLEERIVKIRSILGDKAKEYAGPTDRLHNFKKAALFMRGTPAEACLGFLTKHLVSVADIATGVCHTVSAGMIDEKIGDAINYLILLEAILKETPAK